MTLFKQIVLVILLSLVMNLLGVLWLSADSTKQYLSDQLESDLENTQTSLGMALLPFIESDDKVMIESTMKAYFDSGYYQKISIRLLNSNEVIGHEVERQVNRVPDWFVRFNKINVPETKTTLTSGWLQVAELTIIGHPGFAYVQLWQSFINFLSLFAGLTLVVVAVASVGIRHILAPLNRIKVKASQIAQRKFGDEITLPNTLELRALVSAFNTMSDRLKQQFEQDTALHNKLKEQAFRDAVSGLGNRAFFNRQLESWMTQEPNGFLVFLSINGLEEIKLRDGFVKRDEMISLVTHFIEQSTIKVNDAVNCRLSANEFSLLLPHVDANQCQTIIEQLSRLLSSEDFVNHFYHGNIFAIGAAEIEKAILPSDALSLLDMALLKAKVGPKHYFIASQASITEQHIQRKEIKQAILEAIKHSSIAFVKQAVMSFDDDKPMHFEAFAKLNREPQGSDLPANLFISVLDEFDLGTEFDKKAIEIILHKAALDKEEHYAVNLSASALQSQQFIDWLLTLLTSYSHKELISFEFSEESVIYNKDNIHQLVTGLREMNVEYGIDRVARNFSSLAYLKDIQPRYVKIDPVFTQMAISGDNDAYFVSSLCAAIHNLNIHVIASHVESTEHLEQIKSLQFDGYQGYISRPEKL